MVLMSGRILGFVAAFAIPVVLVRIFDQSEFGTYKQLFLVYSTLYGIAQFGMAESLFYFLPAAQRLGGRYVLNAMLVLGCAGTGCLAILWGTQSSIAHWFNNIALIGYLPLIGYYLLLMLISSVLEIVMTARKRHLLASATYAVSDLLRAALFIVPVFFFSQLEWLLIGAIAFASLRLGATLFYLRRQYGSDLVPHVDVARTQLIYAAPFSVYVIIEVIQINLHQYAVSYYFDAATYAIYAVGCLSIPLVDFLTSSANNVMMVRMREHLLNGATRSVLEIWGDTTRKLVIVFAPLVGGLLIVAHELIVILFTESYAKSVPVFMIWTTTILLSSLLTDSVLRVYSQIRFLMMLGLIKLILIAVTINWFLEIFDLEGAVLVVVMTIMVTKAVAIARIKTVMQCRLAEFLPWKNLAIIIAVAIISTVPALLVKSMMTLADFPQLLISGLIYAMSYLSILWRYGLLSDDEKNAIIRSIIRIFWFRREYNQHL